MQYSQHAHGLWCNRSLVVLKNFPSRKQTNILLQSPSAEAPSHEDRDSCFAATAARSGLDIRKGLVSSM
jgi:hypothetical protein